MMSQKGFLEVPTPGGLAPLKPPQNLSATPTGSATGNPRNKVALKPGFSLMDWIRLTKSGKDLAGTGGKLLKVTPNELAKHRKKDDCWMALNGIVYNVSAYMDYHPGGWDELMKGAGKDATKLFNDVHKWVNYESMLSACIVGKLVTEFLPPPNSKASSKKSMSPQSVLPSLVAPSGPEKPKFDWHQTDSSVTLSIYTRRKHMMRTEHVSIHYKRPENKLHILVRLPDDHTAFNLAFVLEQSLHVDEAFGLNVLPGSGKVEVLLHKSSLDRWSRLGAPLEGNETWVSENLLPTVKDFATFRRWKMVSKSFSTHDVNHYAFQLQDQSDSHFQVPCGHHVQFRMEIEGMEIVRSYTPTFEDLNLKAYDNLKADKRLHFVIKHYRDGALTSVLNELPLESEVEISQPQGTFNANLLKKAEWILLLSAGTGITPMCKAIQFTFHQCCKDQVKRKIVLLNFNKTQEDIIWRQHLEDIPKASENFEFHVEHILSQEEDWPGLKGRVNKDLLKGFLEENCSKKLACVCGPIPFTKECYKILNEDFNFTHEQLWKFEG